MMMLTCRMLFRYHFLWTLAVSESGAAGSEMLKVLPFPTSDSREMMPPWASTMVLWPFIFDFKKCSPPRFSAAQADFFVCVGVENGVAEMIDDALALRGQHIGIKKALRFRDVVFYSVGFGGGKGGKIWGIRSGENNFFLTVHGKDKFAAFYHLV